MNDSPLIVIAHRPHAKASPKWLIYDTSAPPDTQQIASFDCEHLALATATVLEQNLGDWRMALNALGAREPF